MLNPLKHRYEPVEHVVDEDRPSSERLVFDRKAVREVDRVAIEEFGFPGILLMENAARGLADEAMRMLGSAAETSCVLIICGGGNNGGDGYALARHLHNRGVDVAIVSIEPPPRNTDAATNLAICQRMELREVPVERLDEFVESVHVGLIVDAIFGTGLDRSIAPGRYADIIQWINAAKRPVLAVDIPSGMDCNTGKPMGPVVKATKTVTFVGIKTGFIELDAQKLLGEVVVVDIGVPRGVRERLGRLTACHREPPEHLELQPEAAAPPAR
jgi:NAD(P)H-hydrate epimerase